MNVLLKLFGDPNEKELKRIRPVVERVNSLEKLYRPLDIPALRDVTGELRKRLAGGSSLDDVLPDAFAAVRESSRRSLGMRHYDVQLLGGIILHHGKIAEMRTGEGKTLVATLPLYLNALAGKGAHLVTVNDYLAKRDAVWMGPVYHGLGMTVGVIQHDAAFVYDPEYKAEARSSKVTPEKREYDHTEGDDDTVAAMVAVEMDFLRPVSRKEAYAADITYGTNNEFGFDYLRDNMVARLSDQTQRGLFFGIVDEVDSILIDEARTPLIISAADTEPTEKYYQFAHLVDRLEEGIDFNVDEKLRAATLTESGIEKLEKWLGVENIYVERGIREVHHIEQALRARTLFKRDRDYVVKGSEVVIVDEFTGRMMYGRRYSDGLHQAIEAKENVKIQRESVTMATITFQNLFRMYQKLSGMTGTALTEAEEFHKIYGLETVVVPTHRPLVRVDRPDRVYKNHAGKLAAVVDEIKARKERGQPVLVGTISIQKNEMLSAALTAARIPHEVLNAKNHEREAQIIADAGRAGAVTIATNMAGRGVDIILGGNPLERSSFEKVKELGGLCVIGTERHESRRIDNQLRGRAGRQGDPGESIFFVSMEDDLMRIFGSDRIRGMMQKLGFPDDMPIEHNLITRSIEQAQKKVEGHHFDTRKHLVEYDDVINKHREVIYERRRRILNLASDQTEGALAELSALVFAHIEKELTDVVSFHTSEPAKSAWNIDEIYETLDSIFPVPFGVRLKLEDIERQNNVPPGAPAETGARDAIIAYLISLARSSFEALATSFEDQAARQFILSSILVRSIDTLWVEHLDAMDHLRRGIGLRGYGQRDPLVEYKKEAFRMFQALQANIQKQVVYSVFKIGAAKEWAAAQKAKAALSEAYQSPQTLSGAAKTGEAAGAAFSDSSGSVSMGPVSSTLPHVAVQAAESRNRDQAGNKIGRNDPCWCGSGKKFKRCHGA